MKVIITDKRRNPRMLIIDGKRYIFPSNKPVTRDISTVAYNILSQYTWIEIQEVKEEPPKEEPPKEEPTKEVKEEPKKDLDKEPIAEEIKDTPATEEIKVESSNESDSTVENSVIKESSDKGDKAYSSMTKKELKALVEEKGGNTSGMSKANLIDWLNSNP